MLRALNWLQEYVLGCPDCGVEWMNQDNPNLAIWKLWSCALALIANSKDVLFVPLHQWITPNDQQRLVILQCSHPSCTRWCHNLLLSLKNYVSPSKHTEPSSRFSWVAWQAGCTKYHTLLTTSHPNTHCPSNLKLILVGNTFSKAESPLSGQRCNNGSQKWKDVTDPRGPGRFWTLSLPLE